MNQAIQSAGIQITEALNKDCFCISVDRNKLHQNLEAHLAESGLPSQLLDIHSNLFADSPVFLWQEHIERMQRFIQAVETVTRNEAYRKAVLPSANISKDLGPRGVFFGYDFHLGADGPKLIEINTNAGGVLLNYYLAAAQQACCDEVTTFFGGQTSFADAENELVNMFREEWHLRPGDEPLQNIAIVDNEPASQFLYPEFLLFQSLFKRHGIEVLITDPKDFRLKDGVLRIGEQKTDLVYNRLTDFYLELPESAVLREAYQSGAAVFTPSPYHYALYADKRNLPLLSDPDKLQEFGIDEETIEILIDMLPKTVTVTKDNADQLWNDRKKLFFKPVTGYGSRGAYRGAKLTRKTWENIVQGGYIAQALVPPSERQLMINGEKQSLKLDFRCVTYNGNIQQLSARLYEGQTTNLRTEGGGLATVFVTPGGRCC
jgi:hypothetical protein